MLSKTQISRRIAQKRNPLLVETLKECKKNDAWLEVAAMLARPTKKLLCVNLRDIDLASKEGDLIVVPGKVLADGQITKKVRVIALQFSKSAREKLKEKRAEIAQIIDEIKINPRAEGIYVMGGKK